ncbi:cytochrome P450 76M5-like [Typha angustifolia]|uniref:cytochrome P450 76M5-like n=1 Tax=Typha angustifolia TaxID=59011 RepID=UPI003C2B0FD4
MEVPAPLLCIPLVISLLYLLLSLLKRRPSTLPPGPTALPILGNLFDLDSSLLHRSLARLAKTHGPVLTLKLGLTTTIVISSRNSAREALQKKDRAISARWVPDVAHVIGHSERSIVWLPTSNPSWKQLRSISATYLFSQRSLEVSRHLRHQKVRELVDYVRLRTGRTIDVGYVVYGTMINLLSNALFSVDVVDLNNESSQGFRELISGLVEVSGTPNISDIFPFLSALDLQGMRRRCAAMLKKFYKAIDDIIEERMRSSKCGVEKFRGDFLDSLLQRHAKSELSRQEIVSLLADLFAAGTDTSSITIQWAMAELLRHPNVLSRARSEMQELVGSKQLTESDIPRLPYLQAVVKEVMRLHPAGPLLLPHMVAESDVELCGYHLPRGARVLVNAWAVMRDPEVWPDPEAFKPERFLDPDSDLQGRDFGFLPFGSGRRSCPGAPMATRMVPLVLGSLLHKFDWMLPEGVGPGDVDLSEKFGAALSMAVGLKAVPVL